MARCVASTIVALRLSAIRQPIICNARSPNSVSHLQVHTAPGMKRTVKRSFGFVT